LFVVGVTLVNVTFWAGQTQISILKTAVTAFGGFSASWTRVLGLILEVFKKNLKKLQKPPKILPFFTYFTYHSNSISVLAVAQGVLPF